MGNPVGQQSRALVPSPTLLWLHPLPSAPPPPPDPAHLAARGLTGLQGFPPVDLVAPDPAAKLISQPAGRGNEGLEPQPP